MEGSPYEIPSELAKFVIQYAEKGVLMAEQVQAGAEEITVKVSQKNPPKSVDPQQVAARVKQLRLVLKTLTTPKLTVPAIDAAFSDLEQLISARTSKETRLLALQRVRQAINKENSDQIAMFKQAQALVQGIPTEPSLPSTNADNIVRAIAAILRSNGVVS